MSDSDISITYETLFEILRLEKNRVELQKLDKDFYANVSRYIKEKTKIYNTEESKDQNQKEVELKQLSNMKKIFRDIYFRRIRKIMNMALSISVTSNSVVERDSLLDIEYEIFENILNELENNKKEVLDRIIDGKDLEEKKDQEPKSDNLLIRFVKDMPKFVGEDLEEYGPYKAEEMANLPRNLADILIQNGSAESINDS